MDVFDQGLQFCRIWTFGPLWASHSKALNFSILKLVAVKGSPLNHHSGILYQPWSQLPNRGFFEGLYRVVLKGLPGCM